MEKKEKITLGGLGLLGGEEDDLTLCLLSFFTEEKRFVLEIHKKETGELRTTEDVLVDWINKFEISELVIEIPLTKPHFFEKNSDLSYQKANERIQDILNLDKLKRSETPKKYERDRNEKDLFYIKKNLFEKSNDSYLIDKSFKRRLKKGLINYWNRPIDFYLWLSYYNQMLEIFNEVYDSYGHIPTKLYFKFEYLRKFIPENVLLNESNEKIVLLEMHRAGILEISDLYDLKKGQNLIMAREKILMKLEGIFDFFIYDNDWQLIAHDPKVFSTFLLTIAIQMKYLKRTWDLSKLSLDPNTRFIVPSFFE